MAKRQFAKIELEGFEFRDAYSELLTMLCNFRDIKPRLGLLTGTELARYLDGNTREYLVKLAVLITDTLREMAEVDPRKHPGLIFMDRKKTRKEARLALRKIQDAAQFALGEGTSTEVVGRGRRSQ